MATSVVRIVPQKLVFLDGEYVVELIAPGVEAPRATDDLITASSPEGTTRVRSANPDDDDRWIAVYSGGSAHGLDEPGMTVSLAAPLSAAGCPIFVISTAVADMVLVPAARRAHVVSVLAAAGHVVTV